MHQFGGIGECQEILVEQGLALEFSYFRGGGFEPIVSLAELVGKSGASVRAVGCHRCVGDEFFSAVLADFAVGSSWCVHSGSIGLHQRFSVSILFKVVQRCPTCGVHWHGGRKDMKSCTA